MPKTLDLGSLVSPYHVGTGQLENDLSYWSELGPWILHQNMLFHGHIEIPQLSQKCYKFPSNICYFQIPLQLVSKVYLGSSGLA